jgi:hypothetical protein
MLLPPPRAPLGGPLRPDTLPKLPANARMHDQPLKEPLPAAATINATANVSVVQKSGGIAVKRDACLRCVADKAGAWACGECTARYGSVCEVERCADCLRGGGDAWSCYTASYAAACGAGRRLRSA